MQKLLHVVIKTVYKMKNNTELRYFLWIVLLVLVSACAQISSPTGGKSDNKPPKIKLANPANESVNFTAKKVEIEFDEYIQLNGLSEQLIISPPLKKTPEFKIKNKSIVFDIKDTLKPNTTYTFNFGNTIGDITESNKVENFQYVFSTGSVIDSLSITGTIKDALTGEGQKGFAVLLYKIDDIKTDSFFTKQTPSYFAKTNDKGAYTIKNLARATYKLVALKDINANYLFDSPEEIIAFLSTEITLQKQINDVDLFSFKEEPKKVFVKSASTDGFGKIIIVVNKSHQNISVEELKPTTNFNNNIQEIAANKDSITIWMPNQNTDSLFLKVLVNNVVIDTVNLRLQKKLDKKEPASARGKANANTFLFEVTKTNISANTKELFNLYNPIYLQFKQPIKEANFSGITVSKGKVTVPCSVKFTDKNKRILHIEAAFMADSSYTLYLPKQSFIDVFSLSNDSLVYKLTLQNPDNYGKIKLEITAAEKSYILQLLTKDNKLIKEVLFKGNFSFVMNNLLPQSYQIKVIEDDNNNLRWDTGNFYEKKQAEKIYIFSKPLDVRANWDLEEKWEIK